MVKKLLCVLMAVAMILSVSLSAVASSGTVQLMTEAEETQSIEIPDAISGEDISGDNQQKLMDIESTVPFSRGIFTLTDKHYLERNTGLTTFNAWKPDNFTDTISGRVYNNSGDPRDEAILQFTTTAEGLNEDDKVILTLALKSQAELGVGATARIVGIVDENYAFQGTLPVVDKNYIFTTTETLDLDFKKFSFDVTSYVKARLLAGSDKISFLIELVDADWKTGDGSVYMDLALAPYNVVPTLTYKETPLSSLSYDGKDIKIVEGQKTYIVKVDSDAVPLVSAEAENSTVEIAQVTSVPGSAIIKVNTHGTETQYKVNFIHSDYSGAATAESAFSITRNTTTGKFDANLSAVSMSKENASVNIRTDTKLKLRQEGAVVFNIENLLGVTESQKIVLTVYGYGNTAAVDAGYKVIFRGITGEGLAVGGKYGTDVSYEKESTNVLTSNEYTAYKVDVTDYIKSKIHAGEKTASFAVRIPEGIASTSFCWCCGGSRTPMLTVEEISTELSDIKVDGVSVTDFSSSRLSYTHYVADDFVGVPEVIAVKKDSDANAYVELPELIPGTAVIEVTNPSGKSTVYEVKLRHESSKTNPTTYTKTPYVTYKDAVSGDVLNSLTAGGKVKAELNLKNLKGESDVTFVTALYNDGFLVTKKSIKKTGSETALVNTLDINLTDVSKATVKSFILNGYGDGKNIVNCAQLNSSNNLIKSVTISGVDFYEFDTNVFDYTLNVPASVLSYPDFKVTAQDSGAKVETIVPVYLSGAVKLKATAGNGEEKTYTVNIKRAKEKISNITMDYAKLDGVNKKITVFENIRNPIYSPVPSNPPVEGSSTGADFNKEYALANCQNPVNFLTDRTNYWIAEMDERFEGGYLIAVPFDGINPSNNPNILNYTKSTGFIEFDINRSATVYVFHSETSMPVWASQEGFTSVTDLSSNNIFIGGSDGSVQLKAMKHAYSKYYSVPEWSEEPVTVSLGGISNHNYWWIIVVFDK